MNPFARHLLLVVGLAASSACAPEPAGEAPAASTDLYKYREPSAYGVGKIYMGREIANVMGHQGSYWLQRPEREEEERTDLLLQNLLLEPGDNVADVGAGSGYFSLPMAELVGPDGTVFAVDIQPEMLAKLERRATGADIANIALVLADEQDPNLPADTIDLALFVDAYHEFAWPREVMTAVYRSLVPGGRIVLVEYRAEDPTVPILPSHKMTVAQVRKEIEAAGFLFVENGEFLPRQHFLIFEKPAG